MANQLHMAEVQAILALVGHGWSYRRIARELGVDRATVRRYVKLAARRKAANPAMALTGSADALAGHEGSSADPNPTMALTGSEPGTSRIHLSAAWPFREVIGQKLQQGLSAQRIFQDLSDPDQGHGYAGSYHSVRRLIQKLLARRDLPVRRMECEPGVEAQVDFGRGAPVIGPDGKKKATWIFRIVLSHSRKAYSEAVFRQSTDDFLRCMENAFVYLVLARRERFTSDERAWEQIEPAWRANAHDHPDVCMSGSC